MFSDKDSSFEKLKNRHKWGQPCLWRVNDCNWNFFTFLHWIPGCFPLLLYTAKVWFCESLESAFFLKVISQSEILNATGKLCYFTSGWLEECGYKVVLSQGLWGQENLENQASQYKGGSRKESRSPPNMTAATHQQLYFTNWNMPCPELGEKNPNISRNWVQSSS